MKPKRWRFCMTLLVPDCRVIDLDHLQKWIHENLGSGAVIEQQEVRPFVYATLLDEVGTGALFGNTGTDCARIRMSGTAMIPFIDEAAQRLIKDLGHPTWTLLMSCRTDTWWDRCIWPRAWSRYFVRAGVPSLHTLPAVK